jgi:peptidoglycan/xylan/chitin deacetylase (PgdA/CDA1 family)
MTAPRRMKRVMMQLLTSAPVMALAPRQQGVATIFMLHRFGPEGHGHDPEVVRQLLAWLRQQHFELLDLEDLFRRLAGEGPPLRRAVALTIDDGYWCQAEVAAPLFAEFDVPVTTFLTTGFLDGQLWLWWDQIEYILQNTWKDRLAFTVGNRQFQLDLLGPDGLRGAIRTVSEYCKALPDAERQAAIVELAAEATVPVPGSPPHTYRPMTWAQARRCEAAGMRFGAHTVTHPILARTNDAQSRDEIEHSWHRLQAELTRPMPVFCYPNGRSGDFGEREFDTLRRVGALGAVTAQAGYATCLAFAEPHGAFRVPRFSFSEQHEQNLRYASHLEWLWQRVRSRRPSVRV